MCARVIFLLIWHLTLVHICTMTLTLDILSMQIITFYTTHVILSFITVFFAAKGMLYLNWCTWTINYLTFILFCFWGVSSEYESGNVTIVTCVHRNWLEMPCKSSVRALCLKHTYTHYLLPLTYYRILVTIYVDLQWCNHASVGTI